MLRPPVEPPDLREKGAAQGGQPQTSDRRLFLQLQVFTDCLDVPAVEAALQGSGLETVLYEDVNDPRGIGLLALAQDPAVLVGPLRQLLNQNPFRSLRHRPAFTMIGRTYAIGCEPDLNEVLFERPRRTVMNPAWPWAVWYPLRRKGSFAQIPEEEQRAILAEHGRIGHAFGAGDYAHDVRLACYGLDAADNDFVVGLVGKDLFPLSACVQAMRKTRQTALHLEHLGPFFVGRAAWRSGPRS